MQVRATFPRRPTACTVALYQPSGSELTASGNASLGATSTINAACGFGQDDRRVVRLSSVAGLKFGGSYLLVNSIGQQETVQLLSLDVAGGCQVAELLAFAYAPNDALEEPTAVRTITATESASYGRGYLARFSGTMPDASVVVRDVPFDVVGHVNAQPITELNLAEHASQLVSAQSAASRGTNWSKLLEHCWSSVQEDFVTRGLRADLYLDENRLRDLHLMRLYMALALEGITVVKEEYPLQALKTYKKTYEELLDAAASVSSYYGSDAAPTVHATDTPAPRRRIV